MNATTITVGSIRNVLFIIAPEFKTTDIPSLAIIDSVINLKAGSIDYSVAGVKTEEGIAILSAMQLSSQGFVPIGSPTPSTTGTIKKKKIGEIEIQYDNNSGNSSAFNSTFDKYNYMFQMWKKGIVKTPFPAVIGC